MYRDAIAENIWVLDISSLVYVYEYAGQSKKICSNKSGKKEVTGISSEEHNGFGHF